MDDEDLEFRINTEFAEKYDNWRRKEELQKLKDRYGDDAVEGSSSSSESEDEDAEALTPQIERDFLKTLSYVKGHDPKIYKKDETFYNYDENSVFQPKKKITKDKPMYLKDLERKLILEKNGEMSDDEDEEEDENERQWSPSYVEEQQMLKDSFKTALEDSGDEDDESILKKKHKTNKEKEKEEADYISWLKDQTDDSNTPVQEMKALKQYWNDPHLDEGEKFLRDYILNKGYMEKGEENLQTFHELADDEVEFSEEERLLEEQENFERKYNFRFEEPDSEFIKRYPRTVAESVRRKDKKRADKRQEIKTRKQQEKQRMKEDLKQMKNLKKKEIMEKLDKLKQVTGSVPIHFQDEDLEGDFNPEEHDKLMQKIFNKGYEENCEDETKPEFNDEEFEIENWDDWKGEEIYNDEEYTEEMDENVHCGNLSFNMDADYVPPSQNDFGDEMGKITGKKKRRRASKFAQAVGRKKPVFNPDDGAFDEYVDEYYKLDYEDVIAGIPCRFKYRNVVANDFGLTTENILNAREKELNQWVSLKKTCQYRSEEEELKDVKAYTAKVKYSDKMKKVFTSLYSEESETVKVENFKPRKHHVKKKGNNNSHSDHNENDNKNETETIYQQIKTESRRKADVISIKQTQVNVKGSKVNKNKVKTRKSEGKIFPEETTRKPEKQSVNKNVERMKEGRSFRTKPFRTGGRARKGHGESIGRRMIMNSGVEVSDARLKAYGIDPKKHLYRMKFLAKLKSRKERLQKKQKK